MVIFSSSIVFTNVTRSPSTAAFCRQSQLGVGPSVISSFLASGASVVASGFALPARSTRITDGAIVGCCVCAWPTDVPPIKIMNVNRTTNWYRITIRFSWSLVEYGFTRGILYHFVRLHGFNLEAVNLKLFYPPYIAITTHLGGKQSDKIPSVTNSTIYQRQSHLESYGKSASRRR